jgi:hypothetical protein
VMVFIGACPEIDPRFPGGGFFCRIGQHVASS